jgi:hypothetical protein
VAKATPVASITTYAREKIVAFCKSFLSFHALRRFWRYRAEAGKLLESQLSVHMVEENARILTSFQSF